MRPVVYWVYWSSHEEYEHQQCLVQHGLNVLSQALMSNVTLLSWDRHAVMKADEGITLYLCALITSFDQ